MARPAPWRRNGEWTGRRGAVRSHLPDGLAGSRPGHPRRRAIWRCHRALCDGRRRCGSPATQAARRTRRCHIDASMYEICVQQTYDAILRAQTGERPWRTGNRDAGVFHQGVYPVLGEDRWIAISCATRRAVAQLVESQGSATAAIRQPVTPAGGLDDLAKRPRARQTTAGRRDRRGRVAGHGGPAGARSAAEGRARALVDTRAPAAGSVRSYSHAHALLAQPDRALSRARHRRAFREHRNGSWPVCRPSACNELEKLGVFQ